MWILTKFDAELCCSFRKTLSFQCSSDSLSSFSFFAVWNFKAVWKPEVLSPSGSFEGFIANLGVFEKFRFWTVVFALDRMCKTLVNLFALASSKIHSLFWNRNFVRPVFWERKCSEVYVSWELLLCLLWIKGRNWVSNWTFSLLKLKTQKRWKRECLSTLSSDRRGRRRCKLSSSHKSMFPGWQCVSQFDISQVDWSLQSELSQDRIWL